MRSPSFLGALSLLAIATVTLAGELAWQPIPGAPVGSRNEDLHFVDPTTGWVASFLGQVWTTDDGGETWTQKLQVTSLLRSIHAISASIVVTGSLNPDSLLYRTVDGGETWTDMTGAIADPKPEGICGMDGVGTYVFGVGRFNGGQPRLIKSADSGATWATTDLVPVAHNVVDCYFPSPDSGFVVGGRLDDEDGLTRPLILFTDDGGASWETRWVGGDPLTYCWKIFAVNDDVLYASVQAEAVDGSSGVLKSIDGGTTWTMQTILGYRFMQGIGFATPDVGWVHGFQVEGFETTDGGDTWTQAVIGEPDASMNRFQMFGPTSGFAAGRTIYLYGPATVDVADNVSTSPRPLGLSATPNPFNPHTRLSFKVPRASHVKVRIYTVLGEEVRTLVDETLPAGERTIVWRGRDDDGAPAPSGVYLCRVDAGGTAEDLAITLLK
jgi:photosystem II stability/assembly factor-like uncharacterized protein